MVFTTLIFANILLSLTNRSFEYSILESLTYKNRLFPLIIGITLVLLFSILYIPPFARFFHLSGLNMEQLGMALLIAMVSVFWFEGYKWIKRNRRNVQFGFSQNKCVQRFTILLLRRFVVSLISSHLFVCFDNFLFIADTHLTKEVEDVHNRPRNFHHLYPGCPIYRILLS